jgi:hypothetical protein
MADGGWRMADGGWRDECATLNWLSMAAAIAGKAFVRGRVAVTCDPAANHGQKKAPGD